ncbi:MAG: hypothetical protein K2G37_04965 [Clostridia bacterium]|nr:hypothetical protein [Clostridia bacterium]MDE7328571.1 hypothetical protein [Clostridia bacterium]
MEEEQYNGELTFKKVWEKIKLSGVRIIVYALIGLIVAAGVMGICNIFVSKSQYETSITYYYSGVEEGKDPWGGQMSIVENIRSSAIVSNALTKCGYDEEVVDKLVSPVLKNLSVIPSTSNETLSADGSVVSANYNYRIILAQSSAIDKNINSRNEYSTIVGAITQEYINEFKSEFSIATNLINVENIADGSALNTIQNLFELKQKVNSLAAEASNWSAKVGNFISSSENESFDTLSAKIDGLALKLNAYELFVLQNALDSNGESEYITLSLSRYTKEIESAKASVEALQKAFESNTSIIDPSLQGGTVIIKDTTLIQEQLVSAIAKLEAAQNILGTWEGYQASYEKYGSDFTGLDAEKRAELYNSAVAMANEFINGYNDLLDTYQGMIKDYNEGYSINSLVRVTSGAKQTNTSSLTKMTFIIILAVVIILAVIIAMIVTSKKGQMKIKKLSTKKEEVEESDKIMIEVEAENQDKTE